MWKIKNLISTIEILNEERNFEEGIKYCIDAFFNFSSFGKESTTNISFSLIKDSLKKYTNKVNLIDHFFYLLNLPPQSFFLIYEDSFLSYLNLILQRNLVKPFGTACFIFKASENEEFIKNYIKAYKDEFYIVLPTWKLNKEYYMIAIHNSRG
jgi:hypothetical protein